MIRWDLIVFGKKEQVSSHPESNEKVEHKHEGEGEGERKKRDYKGGKSSGKEGGEGKWRMHL